MADGSDAIADWPLLNALVNTAAGASWVSIHHGGGVGIGRSIHAGMVCVADGTDLAAQKLERVLTADPGTGVMRHADAGYERAVAGRRGARRADPDARGLASPGPGGSPRDRHHRATRCCASAPARSTPEELRSPEVQALIDDLIETKRAANGAGLAANQIGETPRVAVAEVDGTNPRYPYKPPIPLTVMVNPVIEPVGDETLEINEGCLSVPDLRGYLERHVEHPRPLPRPRRRRARRAPQRPDRGHLPARGRPPRRDPVRRPRRPRSPRDLGAVRAPRAGRVRRADRRPSSTRVGCVSCVDRWPPRRSRAWCELAWPAEREAEAVLVEVDGDRIATPGDGSRRPAGRRDAPRRPHPPGPCQRPLARLPAGAPRPHAHGRGDFWTLARADVRAGGAARPRLLPRGSPARPSPRWRWPGSPRWASSTTSTTGRRHAVRGPERDGPRR